jgi:hypothetical protein
MVRPGDDFTFRQYDRVVEFHFGMMVRDHLWRRVTVLCEAGRSALHHTFSALHRIVVERANRLRHSGTVPPHPDAREADNFSNIH